MPGWKLPLAVGTLLPIFRVAFWLSTARTWGDCRTRVLVFFKVACNCAFGNMTEYWPVERWLSRLSAMAEVAVVAGVVDPEVVLGVVVVPLYVIGLLRPSVSPKARSRVLL